MATKKADEQEGDVNDDVQEEKVVTATLATGTVIHGPKSVVDRVKGKTRAKSDNK